MRKLNLDPNNTIVVNATNIGYKYHGIGVYSLNILRELIRLDSDMNFIVYINKSCKSHLRDINFPGNFHLNWVSSIISPDKNFKGHLLRLIYSNFLSIKHRRYLQFNTSQLEINFFRRNQVVTVHDIIPLLFKEYHRKQYFYYKLVIKLGLKYARYIITPSNHSRDLLQQIYSIPNNNIKVIHNGASTVNFSGEQKKQDESKFILYIGRINKMKNIFSLLKAYSLIGNIISHKLVIVGDDEHMLNKEIILAGLSPQLRANVVFKKNLDEESKCLLMKNASAFVFTSLYEGFGLPPLEAMSCGCPVIVSENSSLPEVCGDAAYYVNPRKPSEISKAILTVLKDDVLRNRLISKGLERAGQFTWENSGREHLRVFEYVLSHSCLPADEKQNLYLPLSESRISSIRLNGINY